MRTSTLGPVSGLLAALAITMSPQAVSAQRAPIATLQSEYPTWTLRGDWRGPTGMIGTTLAEDYTVAANDWALTSLIFRERQDDAVAIEFVGRRLCADNECEHQKLADLRAIDGVAGNLTSQKSLFAGDERYATAISVCSSGSGKLKGARMWSARIKADRTLEPSATRAEFSRTNCSDDGWHAPVECGRNQVIVGIKAEGTREKGFMGLSIRCGRIS